MECTKLINKNLYYVGSSTRRLNLFENMFLIPDGMAYNSYLLVEEKTILFDTVDEWVGKQFLENLKYLLNNKNLDYLIINHMELDHSALIETIINLYPNINIILSSKALEMLNNYLGKDYSNICKTVNDNEEIIIGNHTFSFIMAPMVHWPEVMVTYDKTDKILFSADAFGSFGNTIPNIINTNITINDYYIDELRRYYTNIVGKYGIQVQKLLNKVSKLDIQMICPLHGYVIKDKIAMYIEKYSIWSSYTAESNGVCIFYSSMYGSTENACNHLAIKLNDKGINDIKMYDVSHSDISYLISDAFKYKNLIFASPTYNGSIYPKMENFLIDMKNLNISNKNIYLIENGSWAPTASKHMKDILFSMKNMNICEKELKIISVVKDSQRDMINEITEEIIKNILNN